MFYIGQCYNQCLLQLSSFINTFKNIPKIQYIECIYKPFGLVSNKSYIKGIGYKISMNHKGASVFVQSQDTHVHSVQIAKLY